MRSRLLALGITLSCACSFQASTLSSGGADAGARDAAIAVDGAVTVDAPLGQPDAKPGQPDAPMGQADAPLGQPDAKPGPPDAPVGQPDAPVGEPDAPIGEPDATPTFDAKAAPDGPPDFPDAAVVFDAPSAPDAKEEPPDARDKTGVVCGNDVCKAPNDVCCIDEGGAMPFRCEPDIDCPSNGVPYSCDGPEDCNGFACCLAAGGAACTFLGVVCLGVEVCHTDDDCSGSNHCCLDNPYATCKPQCN